MKGNRMKDFAERVSLETLSVLNSSNVKSVNNTSDIRSYNIMNGGGGFSSSSLSASLFKSLNASSAAKIYKF